MDTLSVSLSLCISVSLSVPLSVCLSVCLSVTPFWHCFSPCIIVKFSGDRSKFKVTEFEINCAFLAFLDVNSSLNLSKLSNDAQCLEGHRRGALSFWKVIYNFKVTLAKNCHFAIKSLRKIIMLWSLTIFVRNGEADGSWWSWPLLVLGYIGDRSERMSWWDICFDHESCQGSVHMMNGIQPGKLWKTKLPDLLSNGGNLFLTGPRWPHVGPMNFAIWVDILTLNVVTVPTGILALCWVLQC